MTNEEKVFEGELKIEAINTQINALKKQAVSIKTAIQPLKDELKETLIQAGASEVALNGRVMAISYTKKQILNLEKLKETVNPQALQEFKVEAYFDDKACLKTKNTLIRAALKLEGVVDIEEINPALKLKKVPKGE